MVAKKKIVVTLGDPQPKKHVVRFDSDEDGSALSSVYLDNAAVKLLGDPKSITITIEAA